MGEQSPGAAACPAGVGLCILSSGSAGGATGSAGVLQQEGRSGHGKVLGTGKSLEGNSPRRVWHYKGARSRVWQEGRSGQSPVPGEGLGARAGGESNVGWALLLPGLAGTCSAAFSGSKLHILFIFRAKKELF